jgi:hypothetical protein
VANLDRNPSLFIFMQVSTIEWRTGPSGDSVGCVGVNARLSGSSKTHFMRLKNGKLSTNAPS